MGILDKFESVKIENQKRIDEQDYEFCKKEQEEYFKFINLMKKMDSLIFEAVGIKLFDVEKSYYTQNSTNSYISEYDFEKLYELQEIKKSVFASRIIEYFTKKYQVELNQYKYLDTIKGVDITYENVLDYIFLRLNGKSFLEKSIQEVKQATQKIYFYNEYRKCSNIILRGKKVIIDGYFAKQHWYHKNRYVMCGNYGNIFNALWLFDCGELNNGKTELHNRFCGYSNEEREDNFNKYDVTTFTKLNSIKFFKNGKMELVFSSDNYAEEFAFGYLGYQIQKGEEDEE